MKRETYRGIQRSRALHIIVLLEGVPLPVELDEEHAA